MASVGPPRRRILNARLGSWPRLHLACPGQRISASVRIKIWPSSHRGLQSPDKRTPQARSPVLSAARRKLCAGAARVRVVNSRREGLTEAALLQQARQAQLRSPDDALHAPRLPHVAHRYPQHRLSRRPPFQHCDRSDGSQPFG